MKVLALLAGLALQGDIDLVDVEVHGLRLVPEETVLRYLGPLDEFSAPEAFRRLWETGLFEDLRFETEPGAGGARLVVVATEKKILGDVTFVGAPVEEPELRSGIARAGLSLAPARPFGEADALELEALLDTLLGEDFAVETELVDVSETRVDLEVRVASVERPRIARIGFVGNEAVSDEELLDAMRLRPSGLFSRLARRDRFDPETLEADLERVRALYRALGFALASVGPPELSRGPEGLSIVVPVFEGKRYRFGDFDVEPGSLLTEAQIQAWLPEPGELFDGAALASARERVERYYHARGYPSAQVEVGERAAPLGNAVDVTLTVEEGPFARVGRIEFRGNLRHRDADLRSLVDLDETERFDVRELERGVAALMSLGHFTSVEPEVEVAAGANRVDVVYRVEEIERFEYLVGGGLNGTLGASGNGQLVARSLLGRSETLRFDLDLGNRFRNFAAGYRDPATLRSLLGPLGSRLMLAADFRRASVTYPDETSEDTIDVAVGASGPMGSRLQLAALQRFTAFTLDSTLDGDVPFLTPFLGERFQTSRTSLALTLDTRDRAPFPTRGTSLEAGYELVTVDVHAHRARASLARLLSLDGGARHGIAVSARAEAVWSFDETRAEGLPRFERLLLGSENDLRGFEIRGVGPRSDGVVVGGDRLFHASAEYRFQALERLQIVGFFDAGNVWATDFEGEPLPDLRYDAGAEGRLLVPLANVPVRFGYGVNLDRVGDEPKGRFFFTLAIRF